MRKRLSSIAGVNEVDEDSDKDKNLTLTDQGGLTQTNLNEESKAENLKSTKQQQIFPIQDNTDSDDDLLCILKNVKIEGLPPPMEGVKIHETEEEKKIDPMEKKWRWISEITEKQKEAAKSPTE